MNAYNTYVTYFIRTVDVYSTAVQNFFQLKNITSDRGFVQRMIKPRLDLCFNY